MDYRTAPQYPGSKIDLEKKKGILLIVSLVLFGVVYVIGSPFLESSKLIAALVMVPAWILIFVVHNRIEKCLVDDYSEKRRIWCDYWESFDAELKQLKRKCRNMPDCDAKLDLEFKIASMEKYWHKFDSYE